MNHSLSNLIDRLVERIHIDRIYAFSFPVQHGEMSQTQLLFVVQPVKGMPPNALAPIVSLCMADLEEEMPFEMILTGEWSNKVKQGSLFHTYASLPAHLCYRASKKSDMAPTADKNLPGLLELAEVNYGAACSLSDEFRTAAATFAEKEDYTQAGYMLHQCMEVRIKALQSTSGIKSNKRHNVEHLLKTVRTALPKLKEIFPYETDQGALIRMLDQCYVQALKEGNVPIHKFEYGILTEKCDQARELMDQRVNGMLKTIKSYLAQKTEEKLVAKEADKAHLPIATAARQNKAQAVSQVIREDFADFPWLPQYTSDVNKLLDKIHHNHHPEQITMLNYHSGGFSGSNLFAQDEAKEDAGGVKVELYLVVIMKNTGPFHFKTMQVGVVSAMTLYLNVSYIERQLAKGDRFVNTLWSKGRVLRRKSTFEPKFELVEVDWNRELEIIEDSIETTKFVLTEVRKSLDSQEMEVEVNFCILKTMLEAVVISYLQCAVGFVPKDVPLRHLIDWTGVVSTQLIEFLHPATDVERRQMHLFMRPDKIWYKDLFYTFHESPFIDDKSTRAHLLFYEKLLDEIVHESRAMAHPEVEALGKI